nr:fibronectin type III domain-containing protein [Candidatus Paceibacterota bacterium]
MDKYNKLSYSIFLLTAFVLFFFFFLKNADAEFSQGSSMSSTNFKVLDAQHGSFGAVSSSSSGNYILTGNVGDVAIGSSSVADFRLNSGFLYYPKVTAPVLNSATPGVNQVALSWSAAAAYQGLSVGGYNVCIKSGGGSYSCSNVGNTTSSTRTGLTADVSYTFKIEAKDAVGDIIAVSNESSATPSAPSSTPTPTPSSGGGGGGG